MPDFDPYHKWLGISPKDQPPNHYRLLGIELFEDDVEVIDAAANRVMEFLHGIHEGPHVAQAQGLLNKLSAARICLLNGKRKAAYDAGLKAASTPSHKQSPPPKKKTPPYAKPPLPKPKAKS